MNLEAKYFDRLPQKTLNKLKRASYRAVDLIELFFPNPDDFTKKVILDPFQKDFIDTIQFGFPLSQFKFNEIKEPVDGVITIWRRQVGKCVLLDTLVQMSDGSIKKIGELTNKDSVLTYSGESFLPSKNISILPKTKKQCLKITTHSGRTIKCATTHPFLTEVNQTFTKYIMVDNLQVGNRIAMARKLPEVGSKILSDEEVKFLAYMIAEGHMRKREKHGTELTFTNKEKDIVDDFLSTISSYKKLSNSYSYYIKDPSKKKLIEKLGLINKKSGDKFAPRVIFKSSNRQVSIFLSCLINGDGCVQLKKNKTIQIEYCTKSKQLQKDLANLFLRIGMFAHLFSKYNKKFKKYYHYLRFSSSIDINNAKKYLRLCTRKQQILNKSNPTGNDHIDTFPFSKKIREIREKHKLTRRECDKLLGFEVRYEYSLSPSKTEKIKKQFQDFDIDTENIFWDKIATIENIGEQLCIDITVPQFHNHITEGFITHNSWSCGYADSALMILGSTKLGKPPTRIGIIAASEEESKILIEKVKICFEESDFNDFITGKPKLDKIKLVNGSFTKSHTCSHKSIRGAAYHYCFIDEGAQMDESILWSAAIPTTTHGERWIIITTPDGGKGDLMKRFTKAVTSRSLICKGCGAEYSQTKFINSKFPDKNQIWKIPDLPPCENCGINSYKYGIGTWATPWLDPWKCSIIDKKKLKRKLDSFSWSPWARQELLGEVIDEASMVILNDWIVRNTNPRLRNVMKKEYGVKYVLGLDYGRLHDASSFCVTHFDKKKNKIIVDYMETISGEYDYQTDYDAIHSKLKEIVQFYEPVWIVPDATGLGYSQVERIAKDLAGWGVRTRIFTNLRGTREKPKMGFQIQKTTKPDLIGNLITLLSMSVPQIEMPPKTEPEFEELVTELLRFECEVLDGGYIKYGTQNYHDDRVIALALSLWAHKKKIIPRAKPKGIEYNVIRRNYNIAKQQKIKRYALIEETL